MAEGKERKATIFRERNDEDGYRLIESEETIMTSGTNSLPEPLPKPKPDVIEPQSPPERPVQRARRTGFTGACETAGGGSQ